MPKQPSKYQQVIDAYHNCPWQANLVASKSTVTRHLDRHRADNPDCQLCTDSQERERAWWREREEMRKHRADRSNWLRCGCEICICGEIVFVDDDTCENCKRGTHDKMIRAQIRNMDVSAEALRPGPPKRGGRSSSVSRRG